jgi:hypothetical protein
MGIFPLNKRQQQQRLCIINNGLSNWIRIKAERKNNKRGGQLISVVFVSCPILTGRIAKKFSR